MQNALPHLPGTGLDQRSGHLHLRVLDRGVERGGAELLLDPPLLGLQQAAADVRAQILERVEATVDRQVVVDLGKLPALDLLDSHLEGNVATGEILALIVGGEGEGKCAALPGGRACQFPLEALDQIARPKLHELVAPLAAREWLLGAVLPHERAGVVDHDEVALGGCSRDRLQAPEALAQPVELALDLLLLHCRLGAADLQAPVLPERGAREHADLEGELEALPARGQLAEVDVGIADGHDPGVLEGVHIPVRERVAHRFIEHRLAPHALDHQRRGHLATAKAGELQFAAQLTCLALDAPLELLGRHLDLHAHARFGQLGDGRREGGGHRCRTIPCRQMRVLRRAERWWWTGPLGHLVGVGADFTQELARYVRLRLAARRRRCRRGPVR